MNSFLAQDIQHMRGFLSRFSGEPFISLGARGCLDNDAEGCELRVGPAFMFAVSGIEDMPYLEYLVLAATLAPRIADELDRLKTKIAEMKGGEEPKGPSAEEILEDVKALTDLLKLSLGQKPLVENFAATEWNITVFSELDFMLVVNKYVKHVGGVIELHYADTDEYGRKVADIILEDIKEKGGDIGSRQDLTKALKAFGFKAGRTMRGQRYSISVKAYEANMKLLRHKYAGVLPAKDGE